MTQATPPPTAHRRTDDAGGVTVLVRTGPVTAIEELFIALVDVDLGDQLRLQEEIRRLRPAVSPLGPRAALVMRQSPPGIVTPTDRGRDLAAVLPALNADDGLFRDGKPRLRGLHLVATDAPDAGVVALHQAHVAGPEFTAAYFPPLPPTSPLGLMHVTGNDWYRSWGQDLGLRTAITAVSTATPEAVGEAAFAFVLSRDAGRPQPPVLPTPGVLSSRVARDAFFQATFGRPPGWGSGRAGFGRN